MAVGRRGGLSLAAAALVAALFVAGAPATAAPGGRVLLVGTFHGQRGQYTSIQAAVDAARPGDTILVGPGDYHPDTDLRHRPTAAQAALGAFGGVVVRTPDLTIRGMDRNSVILDGTSPAAPLACDPDPQYQELGAPSGRGGHLGRNGIVAFQADRVSIENLTACNFLSGRGSSGNEIWWNGGADTARIGLTGYEGRYLTATSTYYGNPDVAAAYGIFAGGSAGPGRWSQIYASNFDNSGMYVGACRQVCAVVIDQAWMEYNALGYSGTNSGGSIVIEHSRFDNNQDGFDTNTQIRGDPPPPQNGDCPAHRTSPLTRSRSCWVFVDNMVDHNNNAHAPIAPGGYPAAGPVGTGMTLSGARNDTVMGNTFSDNGAWGVLFVPFPDQDKPFPGVTCKNSGGTPMSGFGCVYEAEGNALVHNTFSGNGFFENPTNGDYGEVTLNPGHPQNCFAGNVAPDGSAPPDLETTQAACGPLTTAPQTGGQLLSEVLCDANFGSCPAGSSYPKPSTTGVVLAPRPTNLASMPDPCAGLAANPWCRGGRPI